MTTERIIIEVRENGSRRVRRNFEDIGRTAKRTDSAVRLLQRSLAGVFAASALRSLQQASDTYINLQNRIRVVTSSTQELNAVTQDLFRISNETRSSYEATAEVYTRTALAVKDLGRSQAETIAFTKSLNQAVILSGASAQESKNALIQLSQGLASGALRGDELRAVLEQLPAVADIIADGFGVTRGELKKMGEQGQITAQGIFLAFQKARKELDERFGTTVPTIGQSLEVLSNKALQALGRFDELSGASRFLSKGILDAADNFETLARFAGAAAISVGINFGVKAIGLAIAGIERLTLAIVRNPVGALAVGLSTAIGYLVAFSDKITLTSKSFVTLQDFGKAAIETISNALEGVPQFFKDNFGIAFEFVEEFFENYNFSVKSFLEFSANSLDSLVGLYIGAYNAIIGNFGNFGPALVDIFFQAMNGIISITESGVNNIVGGLNNVLSSLNIGAIADVTLGKLDNLAEGASQRFGKIASEGFEKGFEFDSISQALQRTFERAEEIGTERLKKQAEETKKLEEARKSLAKTGKDLTPPETDKFDDIIAKLHQENDLLRVNSREREILGGMLDAENTLKRSLTQTEDQLLDSLLRENQFLTDQAILYDDVTGSAVEYGNNVVALSQLMLDGKITSDQFTLSLKELELQFLRSFNADSFSGNFLTQLRIMVLESEDAFSQIGTQLAEIYGPGGVVSTSLGDAIGQAVAFGDSLKESVQQAAASIVSELVSSLVQVGINMLLNATIAKSVQASTAASTAAVASATASAWAPAAALASLATLGANSPAAVAAISTTLAASSALSAVSSAFPGFRDGGFTGSVGINQVAGVVHGEEFVFDAPTTKRNRTAFEAIHKGGTAILGNPSDRPVNVNVTNNFADSAEVEVSRNGDDVEVTIRRILQNEAPSIIANDLANANSRTSKALAANTLAQRRRR